MGLFCGKPPSFAGNTCTIQSHANCCAAYRLRIHTIRCVSKERKRKGKRKIDKERERESHSESCELLRSVSAAYPYDTLHIHTQRIDCVFIRCVSKERKRKEKRKIDKEREREREREIQRHANCCAAYQLRIHTIRCVLTACSYAAYRKRERERDRER